MNTLEQDVREILADVRNVHSLVDEMVCDLARAGAIIVEGIRSGGKLFLFGNGGSAAQAQHVAAEFVGRFQVERQPLPAIALTTDTSGLTAIGNDYGFGEIFARQLQALGRAGDIAVGISTSGNSPNVLRAFDVAREMSLRTIGMTGKRGGAMVSRVDLCLSAPSDSTARIQEMHLVMFHILCQLVDSAVIRKQTHL